MNKIWLVCSSCFAVIGCIIGAGFISGTEIYLFFARYGIFGIFLCIFSVLLLIMTLLFLSKNHSILSKNTKNQQILSICQIFISGTMFAGLSSVFQLLGAHCVWSNFFIFLILTLSLYLGISFASKLNIIVGLLCLFLIPISVFSGFSELSIGYLDLAFCDHAIGVVFAALYTFMNVVCGMPVITYLMSTTSKKIMTTIIIITGVLICILQLFIMFAIFTTKQENMPMLNVVAGWVKPVYLVLLIFAMLSTLVSSSMGAKNVCGAKFYTGCNLLWSITVSSMIMLTSFIGFAGIIKIAYPVVGLVLFLTTILPTMIIKVKLRHKK